jgi:hypothetical protein
MPLFEATVFGFQPAPPCMGKEKKLTEEKSRILHSYTKVGYTASNS